MLGQSQKHDIIQVFFHFLRIFQQIFLGEDVPVLANGPWAHLFVGVHEESYFCHAIEHAFGWGADESLFSTSGGNYQHQAVPSIFKFSFVILAVFASR